MRPEDCPELDDCAKVRAVLSKDLPEFQKQEAIRDICGKCDRKLRVLITGICGFVGSHLADYIIDNQSQAEVYGLKRWRSPKDNIRHIEDRLTLYDGDLRDLSSMLAMVKEIEPDWIFHIAAQSFVPYSFSAPIDTLTTNVIGTANLLEAVRLNGIGPRIHICSSPEVYGEMSSPFNENCPLRPLSPYAVSKVGEDALGYMYHEVYDLKTVTSRAFTHTGPRRGDVFVVSTFAKQIARIERGLQEPIIRVGNLQSMRIFCDVRDTVRAYWLLLEKGEPGEVYNIAGNKILTIKEMLRLLLSISRVGDAVEISVDRRLLRPKDVTNQIADDSKFRELTGWEPEIPFNKTLEDTLNYWRENAAVGVR